VASLSPDEIRWFEERREFHEAHYLAGTNPRAQSGFGRDERDWERFRRLVLAAVDRDGTFLDIGCASGLLMESVFEWARQDGRRLEPVQGVFDVVSPEHGFVITRVVSLAN
jgi:hypothetical protein